MTSFQKTILAGLTAGLWVTAVPAHAGAVWAFGEGSQFLGNDGATGSTAQYSSTFIPSSYFAPAGESSSGPAQATYSSNFSNLGQWGGSVTLSGTGALGYTAADMSLGTTHVSDSSSTPGVGGYINVQSAVEEEDQLTFSVAGGGSALITINFTVDGGVTGPSAWENSIQFFLGGEFNYEGSYNSVPYSTQGTGEWQSAEFITVSATEVNFTATYLVNDGQTLNYGFDQQLECNAGDSCDFSNTTQLGIVLPAGVSYTSGALLPNAPEPAPEALIGIGMLVIWLARRRVRRSTR